MKTAAAAAAAVASPERGGVLSPEFGAVRGPDITSDNLRERIFSFTTLGAGAGAGAGTRADDRQEPDELVPSAVRVAGPAATEAAAPSFSARPRLPLAAPRARPDGRDARLTPACAVWRRRSALRSAPCSWGRRAATKPACRRSSASRWRTWWSCGRAAAQPPRPVSSAQFSHNRRCCRAISGEE